MSLSKAPADETDVNERTASAGARGAGLPALLILLAVALAFRMAVIGWGLPPATAEVRASDIRSSYAFDEDDILTPLSFTQPAKLDFDPRQYQWGTLHLHLVLGALELGERLGYFRRSWRQAFYEMLPGDFERVYFAGRLVSIAGGLGSIALMFFFALEYVGRRAALWAASLVAASPAHLLASAQIRVDLTLTVLLILTAWLAVKAQRTGRPGGFFWTGVAMGASMAAKYTAIFLVVPCTAVALARHRFAARPASAVALGAVGGFLMGEPYLLLKAETITDQVLSVVQRSQAIPKGFRIPVAHLLGTHALYSVRFLVGAPAAVLAAAGLILMLRRRAGGDAVALAMLAGGIASFVPLLWPMLRYQLPLLPLLALAAAIALEKCPSRWRMLVGGVGLMVPLAATLDQVRFMRAPHTGNLALAVILKQVPPGTPVARPIPELPPLDRKVYPMGPNPLLDDLSAARPGFVLLTDLPIVEYPRATMRLLQSQYDVAARFEERPLFAWATLGAAGTPHDWKYSHPSLVLYRRRTPPG